MTEKSATSPPNDEFFTVRMSFAGNLGPAVDGGMRPRREAAEDIDAEEHAEAVAAAENDIDGEGNVGAGWTAPASHGPRDSARRPRTPVDPGEYDSQSMLDDGDASGEENATGPPATHQRRRTAEMSDSDGEDPLPVPTRRPAAATAATADTDTADTADDGSKRRNAWSRVYLFNVAATIADFVGAHRMLRLCRCIADCCVANLVCCVCCAALS